MSRKLTNTNNMFVKFQMYAVRTQGKNAAVREEMAKPGEETALELAEVRGTRGGARE